MTSQVDQLTQKLAEQTKPLRNELAGLERSLAAMTQEKANIEAAAAQPDVSPAQRVNVFCSLSGDTPMSEAIASSEGWAW